MKPISEIIPFPSYIIPITDVDKLRPFTVTVVRSSEKKRVGSITPFYIIFLFPENFFGR